MPTVNPYASVVATGPTYTNRRGKVKPLKPKQIEKQILHTRFQNMQQAYPQLWQSIGNLRQQATANPWEQYASLAAPQFEQAGRYFEGAGSNLDRTLASRGLENSSAAGSAYGALEGAHAGARANIYGGVMGRVQDQQQDAQQRMLSLLYQLSTGEADAAAGITDRRLRRQMEERLMEAQMGSGLFSDFAGLLGTGLGGYLGRKG